MPCTRSHGKPVKKRHTGPPPTLHACGLGGTLPSPQPHPSPVGRRRVASSGTYADVFPTWIDDVIFIHSSCIQAKVLERRIVIRDKEQFVEPVPGVMDAVGYVVTLPVNYLLAPAFNWLIYPVYARVSQTVADAVAGGGR